MNYSPKGTTKLSRDSQDRCYAFKRGDRGLVDKMAVILKREENRMIEEYIGQDTVLVPVPRSAPTSKDALWPSLVICEQLLKHGFGNGLIPLVERIKAIPKSQTAGKNRPSIRAQCDSLKVEGGEFPPSKITLVDDVITMGTTTAACVMRLKEAYPTTEIAVFCPVRTQGLILNIEKMVDLSAGRIKWNGGDIHPNRLD